MYFFYFFYYFTNLNLNNEIIKINSQSKYFYSNFALKFKIQTRRKKEIKLI